MILRRQRTRRRLTTRSVVFVVIVALLLTGVTYGVHILRSTDQPNPLPTSYAAFSSKATTGASQLSALIGGSVLIGGISSGELRLANKQTFSVETLNGSAFDIRFPQGALLHALTTRRDSGLSLGNYSVIQQGAQIASGVWSSFQVSDWHRVIGYEFLDDSLGDDYSGAMVMGTSQGTLYLPDGSRIPVTSQRTGPVNSLSAPITLFLYLHDGNTLTCIGTPLRNTTLQGMSGIFQDPVTHHSRVCNALVFSS